MSQVTDSSVVPSDSISNVAVETPPASTTSRGGGRGRGGRGGHSTATHRPATSAIDKNAPQGAVPVQKPGANKSTKTSPVVSATIPITGWGEIDISPPFRVDIVPTFTIDAAPFADLVDTVYRQIQSSLGGNNKHIPRSLFAYQCFSAYHARVLYIMKQNGRVLNAEQKNALNIFSAGVDFQIPSPIAQYLANLGNFSQGGEIYYFRLPERFCDFSGVPENCVTKGWIPTQTAGDIVDSSASFWAYAQTPVPGVYSRAIMHEVDFNVNQVVPNLDFISPEADNRTFVATDNIIGFKSTGHAFPHSSCRSTLGNLGWSSTSMPTDCETVYNVSTSTLAWTSGKLSSLRDIKLHPIADILKSPMGNPIQAYWLEISEPSSSVIPTTTSAGFDRSRRGAFNYEHSIRSRYAMDARLLAPSLSFGYRLMRQKQFRSFSDTRTPVYYEYTPYDPWYAHNTNGNIQAIPGIMAEKDFPLLFGSGNFLQTGRFATHPVLRSAGLDGALVLAQRT